jgi:peroxiredoxin
MKKILMLTVLLSCLVMVAPSLAAGPKVGSTLPDITLAAPPDNADRTYLGWGWGKTFKIPEIQAPYVLIEIFSMYCPYCQDEAPNVNKLYVKIQSDPTLKDKIKVIGIGVGNTAYEVKIFKSLYKIPFPLFPDDDYVIHRQLGEVRTPYFIGVKINSDGTPQVIYSQLGALGDVDPFLKQFVALTDPKPEVTP